MLRAPAAAAVAPTSLQAQPQRQRQRQRQARQMAQPQQQQQQGNRAHLTTGRTTARGETPMRQRSLQATAAALLRNILLPQRRGSPPPAPPPPHPPACATLWGSWWVPPPWRRCAAWSCSAAPWRPPLPPLPQPRPPGPAAAAATTPPSLYVPREGTPRWWRRITPRRRQAPAAPRRLLSLPTLLACRCHQHLPATALPAPPHGRCGCWPHTLAAVATGGRRLGTTARQGCPSQPGRPQCRQQAR